MKTSWRGLGAIMVGMAVFLAGCTVNKVKPLETTKHDERGIVYALPMTVLKIEIPLTLKITNGALEYAGAGGGARTRGWGLSVPGGSIGLAETADGKSQIDCAGYFSETAYAISRKITVGEMKVDQESLPDPSHIYSMDLSSSFLKDAKKNIVFNEKNMIVSGSYSAKDKTLEFTASLLKIAGGFMGIPLAREGTLAPKGGALGEQQLREQAAPAVAAAPSLTAAGRRACEQLKNRLLWQAKQAQHEADILTGRKDALIFGENRGGVDRSFDVWKARLAEADKRINEARKGASLDTSMTLTYKTTITADALSEVSANGTAREGGAPLFWMDGGTIYATDTKAFSGEGGRIVKQGANGPGTPVRLVVRRLQQDPSAVVQQAVNEPKGEQGLYYRMPAQAEVALLVGGETVQTQTVSIAQWGPLMALPKRMGSNDAAITFEFFTDTGALKSIGSETKAIDMAQLEKMGDAGVAMVKAVYASNDEIARLTQEKEKLTLQKDIRDLRTSLQTGE